MALSLAHEQTHPKAGPFSAKRGFSEVQSARYEEVTQIHQKKDVSESSRVWKGRDGPF